MKLKVELNGTSENPYHRWGLVQNPFPQIARAEFASQCLHLQKLGAAPIPNTAYIRKHLQGWSPEFVELCCQKFKPGEYVTFTVNFPAP